MWFEILPSFAIISCALAAPIHIAYLVNKGILGNGYRRCLDERFDRVMYQRDERISGNPYVMNGLDSVADEDPNKKK